MSSETSVNQQIHSKTGYFTTCSKYVNIEHVITTCSMDNYDPAIRSKTDPVCTHHANICLNEIPS